MRYVQIFNVTNMSFNAICENKALPQWRYRSVVY